MKVLTIAKNTLKEVLRDKILYIILFFALAMMAFSTLLYELSMKQDVRIIKDLGLGMISMFGIIITLFIGSSMLYKEIDKKTIYLVLSKPVKRSSFLLGKFIGLAIVLLLITLGLTASFFIILYIRDIPFNYLFLIAIFFTYLELLFLVSVTIFFSTFTSPIITIFSTLVVFLTGRSVTAIFVYIAKISSGMTQTILKGLFYLVPNLEHVNIINQVVYGVPVSLKQGSLVIGYIVLYTFFLLFISQITFEKKDF